MKRRRLLQSVGSALVLTPMVGMASADGDADPRLATEGTLPNKHVPYTETGALGGSPWNENGEIPVGDWILHDNGVNFLKKDHPDCQSQAVRFANNTNHRYVIDGEAFILNEFDDWKFISDNEVNGNSACTLVFEYFTPPKRKGKTYEVRWEMQSEIDEFESWEILFPNSNQVEIVDRNDSDN